MTLAFLVGQSIAQSQNYDFFIPRQVDRKYMFLVIFIT